MFVQMKCLKIKLVISWCRLEKNSVNQDRLRNARMFFITIWFLLSYRFSAFRWWLPTQWHPHRSQVYRRTKQFLWWGKVKITLVTVIPVSSYFCQANLVPRAFLRQAEDGPILLVGGEKPWERSCCQAWSLDWIVDVKFNAPLASTSNNEMKEQRKHCLPLASKQLSQLRSQIKK